MADFAKRERTTRHVEYVLPSPTNWAEVGKVHEAIASELERNGATPREVRADDTVTVEAGDDEIVFRYQIEDFTT